MVKRILCLLVCIACLIPIGAAGAETLGFGFVNAKDVALRKAPGERRIHRLPKDTCVWITDSKTDGKGTLWYKVNAGVRENYTSYDFTGWIMAEFVDAGDEVWHDVTSVSAHGFGMTALRTDGTVVTAGRPWWINGVTTSIRGWADGYTSVVQAGVLNHAMGQFVITSDGTFASYSEWLQNSFAGIPLRLFCGRRPYPAITREQKLVLTEELPLQWLSPQEEPTPEQLARVEQMTCNNSIMLLRTTDGDIMAARFDQDSAESALPDWTAWTELVGISTDTSLNAEDRFDCNVYVGVRRDGSIVAEPQWLEEALSGWTDMAQVELFSTYALGLRKDGTAVSVGLRGHYAPDVSAWRDVKAIDVASTYCVGIKQDGTLIFSGDYIFMGEGHS